MVTANKISLFLAHCELRRLLRMFHNLMFLMGKCFLGQFRIKKCNRLSNITVPNIDMPILQVDLISFPLYSHSSQSNSCPL